MSQHVEAERILISLNIHSKNSVIRTCYALAECAHFSLQPDDQHPDHIWVVISLKSKNDDFTVIKNLFLENLIDFSLRENIEEKTKRIREALISTALLGSASFERKA